MSTHYIVYRFTRFQDGSEEGVKLFNDIDSALVYIEKGMNNQFGATTDYNLFKLGPEIPLEFDKKVTPLPPPPPVEKTLVSVKKAKK